MLNEATGPFFDQWDSALKTTNTLDTCRFKSYNFDLFHVPYYITEAVQFATFISP